MLNRTQINHRVRIIAAMLLATIAWASTVEFTHHHSADASRKINSDRLAIKGDAAVTRASIQTPESSPLSSRSNSYECSICQLHHNLATTLISKLADESHDVAQAASVVEATGVHLSQITATQQGRAPPFLF